MRLPDPIVTRGECLDPEQQVLIGSCVGLALLVVIQALSPAERIAYVLHDMFDVSFDDIAAVLGDAQRNAAEAFIAAARDANFEMLLRVLDPNVVLRSDRGADVLEILGAHKVVQRALAFTKLIAGYQGALVNGAHGIIALGAQGDLMAVLAFAVADGRITQFYVLGDRARLGRLGLARVVGSDT